MTGLSPEMKRLPGRRRSNSAVLAEMRREVDEIASRSSFAAAYATLYYSRLEDWHRWRIQLDCGCIRDCFTADEADLPTRRSDTEPMHGRELAAGEFICCEREGQAIYQDVDSWDFRKFVVHGPDPIEPPDYWPIGDEAWAKMRKTEPSRTAHWVITLACGHPASAATDPEWLPEHGPTYPTPERLEELRAEEAAYVSDREDDPFDVDGHFRREIEAGFPRPSREHTCWSCKNVRYITAYEYCGRLGG